MVVQQNVVLELCKLAAFEEAFTSSYSSPPSQSSNATSSMLFSGSILNSVIHLRDHVHRKHINHMIRLFLVIYFGSSVLYGFLVWMNCVDIVIDQNPQNQLEEPDKADSMAVTPPTRKSEFYTPERDRVDHSTTGTVLPPSPVYLEHDGAEKSPNSPDFLSDSPANQSVGTERSRSRSNSRYAGPSNSAYFDDGVFESIKNRLRFLMELSNSLGKCLWRGGKLMIQMCSFRKEVRIFGGRRGLLLCGIRNMCLAMCVIFLYTACMKFPPLPKADVTIPPLPFNHSKVFVDSEYSTSFIRVRHSTAVVSVNFIFLLCLVCLI